MIDVTASLLTLVPPSHPSSPHCFLSLLHHRVFYSLVSSACVLANAFLGRLRPYRSRSLKHQASTFFQVKSPPRDRVDATTNHLLFPRATASYSLVHPGRSRPFIAFSVYSYSRTVVQRSSMRTIHSNRTPLALLYLILYTQTCLATADENHRRQEAIPNATYLEDLKTQDSEPVVLTLAGRQFTVSSVASPSPS